MSADCNKSSQASAHSPLPWRQTLADSIAGDDEDAIWIECDDHSIAELICPADVVEGNAAFMLRAVSYHESLIAMLEKARKSVCRLKCTNVVRFGDYMPHSEECQEIAALIAKATGSEA
jgi:hypothetical protein